MKDKLTTEQINEIKYFYVRKKYFVEKIMRFIKKTFKKRFFNSKKRYGG